MAEQSNSTALVASPALEGEYVLSIKEFDAAGKSSALAVPVPSNMTVQNMSVMLMAAILKNTTWKMHTLATILLAIAYADHMGLDILAGDIYIAAEGRLSTTAGAKIRHAMSTGKIKGYTVDITDGTQITIKNKQGQEVYKGPNLQAKVSVTVDGWQSPVVYCTTLAEWFVAHNPNWVTRPAYMLRRNALSKALEEVAPMGIEADEAPPEITATLPTVKEIS